ncbi:protein argonaute-2 [Neodiprion pinetum]|uniref:protein argonaute-2 n=1 Tax=Neodiprion pinetum TaxID=441929 RepID=UPI001EDDCD6A|nr:protein argonaute-2-like [Neodiprion pinetum]
MTKKRGKKGKQQDTGQASKSQPAATVSEPGPPPKAAPENPPSGPPSTSSTPPPRGVDRGEDPHPKGRGRSRGRGTTSEPQAPGPGRGAGSTGGPPFQGPLAQGPRPQTPPARGPRPQAPGSQPQQVPQQQPSPQHGLPQQQGPRQPGPQQVPRQQSPWQGPPQQQGPPQPGPQQVPRQQSPWQGPPQQPGPRQPGPQQVPRQQSPWQGPPQQPGPRQPGPQQVPRQQSPWQGPPQQPGPCQPGPQQVPQQPGPRQGPPQPSPQRGPSQQQGPRQTPQQQPQQTDSAKSVESLQEGIAKMSLIPCRKNPAKAGTMGRPIVVEANVVSLKFNSNFNPHAVHYDISFDPDKPKFMLRRTYDAIHEKYFPNRHPAFDGRRNLYSSGVLPFGDGMKAEIEVYNPEREQNKTYKVVISRVADIDLSWLPRVAPGMPQIEQTAVQAIDVVLRHGAASKCVQVGRSFFQPPKGHIVDLGNGMELWVGMFQSAIIGWKPYLNVDVAHKGFPKAINIVEYMREICGSRFSPKDVEYNKINIAKQLKGLKVIYEIPGHPTSKRTQRINDLMQSAVNSIFTLDNGSKTSVYDYFRKEKNYTIKNPELPCVWVGGRNRQIYVPAELCTIVPGQVTIKKMDEIQTSNMIKAAATSTNIRKQKIMNAFASINFNNDPCVKEFGLSVGGGFEKVPARVLDPPVLMYDRQVRVSRGTWRASRFSNAADLQPKTWTILNLNGRYTRENDLYRLADDLISNAIKCGMNLGEALTPFVTLDPPTRDVRGINNFFQQNKNLKLIIVVIPDRGSAYSKVKQAAEIHIGVLTQCIKARTVGRLSEATTSNILLKINSKLNGVNHMIMDNNLKPKCLMKPCIIIGADVTHPPPDAVDVPSIAAVAASHDARAQFKYNIKCQLQPPREEIILDLQRMVKEQLLFFYKSTGYQPQQIIFYRDGVSEGQFAQVLSRELPAIQRACGQLNANYKPPITFLVVQKRHHVRLFPTDERNSDDARKNFNVQAGTVVDTMITHPSHIDFYLVSHASIQGMARPTKYRCLWDDSKMSEDEIEQLTYYLCHMFSRCTRSVSYPAPTYYAHLAAYRARVHTEEVPINIHNLIEEQRKKLTLHEGIIENPMFFV